MQSRINGLPQGILMTQLAPRRPGDRVLQACSDSDDIWLGTAAGEAAMNAVNVMQLRW